jgi:hypothetical protein
MDPMKRFMVTALAVLVVPAVQAQASSKSNQTKDVNPRITYETAKLTAKAKAPRATLVSHELEHEHGRLIYSFEFAEPGKSGVKEVNVDANSGKVVSVEHESLKAEQQDKVKAAKKSATHS